MTVQGIEQIAPGGKLLAIIVRAQVTTEKKYNFLTDQDSALQLGVSSYPGGERIPAHAHLRTEVNVPSGQEFILVKSGKLRVNLYDAETRQQLSVQDLSAGDAILLVAGGHGFEVLEACQIVEVKQGPYLSKEKDKVVWDT
ncbi:MAG TPA: hypothetical protein VEQ58_04050 [Polyangiaceae bacterium]|nr:hypothetical protein [Polyangiaceae bacterium]